MVIGTTGQFWPFKPIGLNGSRFSYTKSYITATCQIICWHNQGGFLDIWKEEGPLFGVCVHNLVNFRQGSERSMPPLPPKTKTKLQKVIFFRHLLRINSAELPSWVPDHQDAGAGEGGGGKLWASDEKIQWRLRWLSCTRVSPWPFLTDSFG